MNSRLIRVSLIVCLLAVPLIPMAAFFKGEKGEELCSLHTCGCMSVPHDLNDCCCSNVTIISQMQCSVEKEDAFDFTSTFILSLSCAGIPDQFSATLDIISLPDNGPSLQAGHSFYYLYQHSFVPTSLRLFISDKPPRIS